MRSVAPPPYHWLQKPPSPLEVLEANRTYRAVQPCEPQLGKRGLYPTLSKRDSTREVRTMMNLLAYADGSADLLAVAETIGAPARELAPIARRLVEAGVLEEESQD